MTFALRSGLVLTATRVATSSPAAGYEAGSAGAIAEAPATKVVARRNTASAYVAKKRVVVISSQYRARIRNPRSADVRLAADRQNACAPSAARRLDLDLVAHLASHERAPDR